METGQRSNQSDRQAIIRQQITKAVLLIILVIYAAPVSALVVTFKSEATIDATVIRLADIADFSEESELARALASQLVGQAPAVGDHLSLDGRTVIEHFVRSNPDSRNISWQGSSKINISRNSIEIGPKRIEVLIAEYLQDNTQLLPAAEIRFIPTSLPLPFLVPAGEVSHEVIPANPNILGSKRFTLIFRVDGRVRKNMSVRGHLEVLAPVAVATGGFRKGTVLTDEHLQMSVRDISGLKNPCLDKREILGRKLNRRIQAGGAVSLNQVDIPPLIHRGQLVRIIVQQGSMFLTATGVARNDGKHNQTIRVQNISSNRIVYCRVTAPGIVEVVL